MKSFLRGLAPQYLHQTSYLLLVLAQIMVSINIVGSKSLVASFPILFLLSVRFFFATIILGLLHYFTNFQVNSLQYLRQLDRKTWIFILAQAVTAGVLFNFMMVLGLKYTNANVAGIITSTLPAIIAIMSWLCLRERINLKKGLCIGFATIGLIIVNADKFNGIKINNSLGGDFIVLLALIPEASYYVLCKLHPINLPVFLISALINAINAAMLIPMMLWQINWQTLHVSLSESFTLGLVSLSSGLFYVFWYLGSSKVESSLASLSTAVMPIATIFIAWLTLGEKINLMQLVGVGLVVLSIIVFARADKSNLAYS
ncbi:MAG: DMT family transporter [Gammaproteobacteria bacterium]